MVAARSSLGGMSQGPDTASACARCAGPTLRSSKAAVHSTSPRITRPRSAQRRHCHLGAASKLSNITAQLSAPAVARALQRKARQIESYAARKERCGRSCDLSQCSAHKRHAVNMHVKELCTSRCGSTGSTCACAQHLLPTAPRRPGVSRRAGSALYRALLLFEWAKGRRLAAVRSSPPARTVQL